MYLSLFNQKFNKFGDSQVLLSGHESIIPVNYEGLRESNPKLASELFDHNSASEAAIEIPKFRKMALVDKLSGNQMQFLNKPYRKQLINDG